MNSPFEVWPAQQRLISNPKILSQAEKYAEKKERYCGGDNLGNSSGTSYRLR